MYLSVHDCLPLKYINHIENINSCQKDRVVDLGEHASVHLKS